MAVKLEWFLGYPSAETLLVLQELDASKADDGRR